MFVHHVETDGYITGGRAQQTSFVPFHIAQVMDFSTYTRFYFPLVKGNGYEYTEIYPGSEQYLFRYKYKMHHNQTLTKYGYLVSEGTKEMIFHMTISDKRQVANELKLMKEIQKHPRVPDGLTVLDHSTASAVRYEIQERRRSKVRLTRKPSILDHQITKIKRKISFDKTLPGDTHQRKLKFNNVDMVCPFDPDAPSSTVSDPLKIPLLSIPAKSALKPTTVRKPGNLTERLLRRATFLILSKS
ncbi:hypothetical protein K493DRAFT_353530 [Basidiobolus meristosporus CBS 931.73]|uniref:Uncharacterized protein n=1 Tax=Basidiobolus meristosporus CBS 931.73 TaxID=1314790 RepID=A0A1Y1Y5K0_9FUNG|nr:hypothetical protein K493DRAFT_353530 [Basidiobolus meristosporus CBS 931.73]|eukprot:ORX93292.1 hypothetical protein K493DRAFT_353530 [Basidiobolus meristosporus CBS 931.73]